MTTTANSVILPQSVGNGIATLTSATPITSRANITGTTGLVQLKAAAANGSKVYEIKYKAKATMVAGSLSIWRYNGTTAFLEDEIKIENTTAASTTVPSDSGRRGYENLVLLPTESLWVSQTVANDMNVFAQCADL
jgi:hypothetical protein